MAVIKRYSLQLIFTLGLLLGLQLPHFLQQYELRLQGHFAEAQLQFAQFQSLADIYFDGDLQALINKHKNSKIALFRDEAVIIENSYLRILQLQQQVSLLKQPIYYRLAALTRATQQPIFNETWRSYEANIVLNQAAIIVGISIAIMLVLMIEFLLFMMAVILRRLKNKLFQSKSIKQFPN